MSGVHQNLDKQFILQILNKNNFTCRGFGLKLFAKSGFKFFRSYQLDYLMDNNCRRQDKRKSMGPKRSATPLDNFLTPGVLFRFPSNFFDSKMPATFVSACSICPTGINSFANIDSNIFESFYWNLRRKDDNSQLTGLEESESNSGNSCRSMSPLSTLSSDTTIVPQSQIKSLYAKRKRCESCGTRKTPYWRDGWGLGVALCNACGIRFHKYRKVCETCSCIAKKDEKGHLHCPKCFDKL